MRRLWREAVRAGYLLRDRFRRPPANRERGFWQRVWQEAADEAGATLTDLGSGFLELARDGRRTRVRGPLVQLDDPVTLELAGDKAMVHRLLHEAGLPAPDFATFDLNDFGAAEEFLRRIGAPGVVKPLRGSGAGRGVTVGVETARELRRAAFQASVFGRELIVERLVPGDVYRLLYLDGEFLDAVHRRAPRVVGDGKSSVRQLIDAENRRRADAPFSTGSIALDEDCRATVRRAGFRLGSVPPAGAVVPVKSTSNAGGVHESESVRERIGAELRADAARAARAVGVRLAGVDVITKDPGVSLAKSGGVVNEVNTTPGLHWHYRIANPEQGVKVAIPILARLLEEAVAVQA